jgi:uncharacterized protein (DUF1330 family)
MPTQRAGDPGRETYARYAEAAATHLARVGGELLWAGDCAETVIGPEAREWDSVALVRHPSRAAFLDMVADPEYLEAANDRTGALADSRLIPCAELATPAA